MKIGNLYNQLFENTLDCHQIKLTQDIIDEVSRFDSVDALLRAGGISIEALDRAAFGFSDEDIKTLMPKQLHIKWKSDWENVKFEQEKYSSRGMSKASWANKINLEEPIDVIFEKGKFYIDDGHHRTYAAKILNKPLNVSLEIKDNPMVKLGGGLSYDDFHRCVFNQVKGS